MREIDQHEPRADLVRNLLDLRETVHGGGIDPGDEAEVEHKEAAVWLVRKQSFHLFIEPVGGAEEQVALQAHSLDLAAMCGENGELLRSAMERRAVLRPIESEFDCVHAARAHCEGGATDDDPDE